MPLGFRIRRHHRGRAVPRAQSHRRRADGNRLPCATSPTPSRPASLDHAHRSYELNNTVIGNVGGKVLVHTNYKAPRYRLVLIDPKKPQQANWKTVLPETHRTSSTTWSR